MGWKENRIRVLAGPNSTKPLMRKISPMPRPIMPLKKKYRLAGTKTSDGLIRNSTLKQTRAIAVLNPFIQREPFFLVKMEK